MEFHTAHNVKRPVRLSEKTREFAWKSLNGEYGEDTMQVSAVSMDDEYGFETLTEYQKYDLAIKKIASTAPIRICENELVSGAATLGRAIRHEVPATLNGNLLWKSVSHVTLGFDKVLKSGINAMEEKNRPTTDK